MRTKPSNITIFLQKLLKTQENCNEINIGISGKQTKKHYLVEKSTTILSHLIHSSRKASRVVSYESR